MYSKQSSPKKRPENSPPEGADPKNRIKTNPEPETHEAIYEEIWKEISEEHPPPLPKRGPKLKQRSKTLDHIEIQQGFKTFTIEDTIKPSSLKPPQLPERTKLRKPRSKTLDSIPVYTNSSMVNLLYPKAESPSAENSGTRKGIVLEPMQPVFPGESAAIRLLPPRHWQTSEDSVTDETLLEDEYQAMASIFESLDDTLKSKIQSCSHSKESMYENMRDIFQHKPGGVVQEHFGSLNVGEGLLDDDTSTEYLSMNMTGSTEAAGTGKHLGSPSARADKINDQQSFSSSGRYTSKRCVDSKLADQKKKDFAPPLPPRGQRPASLSEAPVGSSAASPNLHVMRRRSLNYIGERPKELESFIHYKRETRSHQYYDSEKRGHPMLVESLSLGEYEGKMYGTVVRPFGVKADKINDVSQFLMMDHRYGNGNGKSEQRYSLSSDHTNHSLTRKLSPSMKDWSIDDVSEFLRSIKLDKYVEVFRENQIDGMLLSDMDETFLKDVFKVENKLAILKLKKAINDGWIPKYICVNKLF
ncbi:uncharacterized protein LOC5506292 [Nematostella vectensis]|uniref:uncharacterized protein LOC5506292 n=1 Tax=Nematostella vectensis TaxID=45351 RepID=UPI0013903D81|nr:uncharacterized protein LOC5506292 [Nematostella vectensis]